MEWAEVAQRPVCTCLTLKLHPETFRFRRRMSPYKLVCTMLAKAQYGAGIKPKTTVVLSQRAADSSKAGSWFMQEARFKAPLQCQKGRSRDPRTWRKMVSLAPRARTWHRHSAQASYPFKQQLKVPAPAGTAFGRPEVHWADGELHLARGPCRSWTRDIEQLDAPAP